ncbi:MAG: Ig-like domain-containing protein, partial [Anaerolineaceae bacterium]|nr:Ig-like domain-containing protein [Anaerolineaceae bacterium]
MWLVLAALAATLGVILLAGSCIGLPPPKLAVASRGEISGRGVIGLTFTQRMQPGSVEARLSVAPAVKGSFRWKGRTVWFHPQQPLLAGQTYTLKLEPGAKSEDGRTIRRVASWRVQVRQPWVVYLSPVTSGADLWRSLPDGSVRERLTHTGGKVIDFAVAFDGERIVFSAVNAQGGADLRLVDRTGAREKILLECGKDWCTDLDWSPDGKRIVFARSGSQPSPGGEPRRGRLWLFDTGSRLAAPFHADEGRTGFDPSWSPDGRRLAFVDGTGAGIRVVDVQTNRELLLPTNQGVVGAWSPDGRQMLFINAPAAFVDQLYTSIFLADFETEEIRPLLTLEGITG